jgi:beta-glucosidase
MRRVGLLAVAIVVLAASAPVAAAQPWMSTGQSPDQRANEMAAQMTLPEKVNLVTGGSLCGGGADGYVPGSPRLALPDLNLVGSGMGVTDLCNRPTNGQATELPAPIAMAASWDPRSAYQDGVLIGQETRDVGFNVAIGGDVNLARDPRNGRTFEAEGEDPVLAGTIVAAQLRGIQSQHLPATIKHFAENNEEQYRGTQSSNVDERTMRELELRAFEIGVKQSGVAAVMCSYNRVNGTPACEDKHLLSDVLKHDWGFKGWVMSDWWACSVPLTFDPTQFCQTDQAANAGLDQEQPNAGYFGPALANAVATGTVPQSRLDDMVHRILRSLFASGVLDNPPTKRPIDVARGSAVAQQVEERAAVLLVNRGPLLPFNRARIKSIAVIGAPANAAPAQSVSLTNSAKVTPINPDTPLQGIRDAAPHANVSYADGSDPAAAAALAKTADVAIVYAQDTEGEGSNKANLTLDGGADNLIAAVAAANPRTAVVLMTGSPVTMPWVGRVGAVLEAWYPGERGGHAIAALLFGDANPSGRLPITFPRSEADLPTAASTTYWPGDQNNISYHEGLLLGYRWYDAKRVAPLFPFGFGLSYGGRFRYSRLSLTPAALRTAPSPVDGPPAITVSFTLTNAGKRAATEVPQVYLGLPSVTGEPPHRLIGWQNITLRPGQSRRVTVAVPARSLAVWDPGHNAWRIPAGSYSVYVGASSRDLRLHQAIPIATHAARHPARVVRP